ncbi:MAG: acyl carrier protein [Flavobacteriaceae bacterium]|nr:acyl carrier protein [Flavobacteriaceae bacterium]
MIKQSMTLTDFTKNISEEFELENTDSLKSDTDYRDLDVWSSMYALILIAYIDREFEVTITGDDLRTSNTLHDIYNLIQERT